MSASYQRSIQDDFDDDGAEAMEYEPSERSLDQKSLMEEIPEPYHFENTNETYDPAQNGFPHTSHFGNEKGGQPGYFNSQDNSQNMSSSFLNLSDSVSQKGEPKGALNEPTCDSAANQDSLVKNHFDNNTQELKQQIVELKRQISLKDQDLNYSKKRNETLNNELNAYKSGSSAIPNQNIENIRKENQFLREKWVDSEAKRKQMEEYIKEVFEDTEEAQLVQLLKVEKGENEKLKEGIEQLTEEKNQLLEYVESSLEEQEGVAKYVESLKEENTKLKDEMNAKMRSSSNLGSEDRQHFDTFGGENDDTLTKHKLKDAEEQIQSLQDQLAQLDQTRTIENKSKNTDIQNLTEKLQIAEREKENTSRSISDIESHFQNKIDSLEANLKALNETNSSLAQSLSKSQQEWEGLKEKLGEIEEKHQKILPLYATLEKTCTETQAELEELREKYTAEVENKPHENINELTERLDQAMTEKDQLRKLSQQQEETVNKKVEKIEKITQEVQEMKAELREKENLIDKLERENNVIQRQIEETKDITQTTEYMTLTEELEKAKEEAQDKDKRFKEIKHDFSKKLNEFQQLSHDYNDCKHALQDLKYGYNNLEAQKKEKDERLKQINSKNDTLTEELHSLQADLTKKSNSELTEANNRLRQVQEEKSHFSKILYSLCSKANSSALLVDEFNESFLTYAKEENFDKKLISRKYRDFMILSDKIKPAKEFTQILDTLSKVEEWILHSAEEFEIQLKNAANFKRKYLKTSERVDQLEDYQITVANEEKRRLKTEKDLKKELNLLNAKIGQVESEKSCSYKREDKAGKQMQVLKQDMKMTTKENQRLTSQIKALVADKERLKLQLRDGDRMKECEGEKNKDLEQRIFQLLYEKDSIMDMLNTLERSIPSTEVKRLFSEYISYQKELFEMEDNKTKLENELLAKEKDLRSTAKEEQLSPTVINLRKDIEVMRKELSNIESVIDEAKQKLSSLKDELHCVEIHEKRRNEVIFETERTLMEKREENEGLKREVGYLSNSKTDMERAYHAVVEEKKIIDRELMMLKVQMGSGNGAGYPMKQNTFHSTMNPGDYNKSKILPTNNYTYSTNMGGNETSSFVSPEIGHKYNSFYPNQSRESQREDITEHYESEGEEMGEDQIIEQSYETESQMEPDEGLSIQDKLQQVKDAFNSIKSSIHLQNN